MPVAQGRRSSLLVIGETREWTRAAARDGIDRRSSGDLVGRDRDELLGCSDTWQPQLGETVERAGR